MITRGEVPPQIEVKISDEIMGALSLFTYLNSCLSGDGGSQEDVNIGVGDVLKNLGAMMKLCEVRSVYLSVRSRSCM